MEHHRKKRAYWLFLLIPLALAFAAGGYLLYQYRDAESVARYALSAMESGTFESTYSGRDASFALRENMFGDRFVDEVDAKVRELTEAEILRRIDRKDFDGARELLPVVAEDRQAELTLLMDERIAAIEAAQAEELARAKAYAAAVALEAQGKNAEAYEAFLALGDYQMSADHAASLKVKLDFAAAAAVFTGENYEEGIAALLALGTAEGNAEAERLTEEWQESLARRRAAIYANAQGRLSAGLWHTAAAGDAPFLAGDARFGAAPEAADKVVSGPTAVYYLKDGRVIHTNETFGAPETVAAFDDVIDAAAGPAHGLFLHENGRVTGLGSASMGRLDVDRWNHITGVAAGAWHSVGLQQSGTVTACGDNRFGQCDVERWDGIVSVKAGLWHTVGLRADGTAVACGSNEYGQCNVAGWTDLVAIDCGACCTVGLRADGTAVACGDNSVGQCEIANWTELCAIAAGGFHTVGLRYDGSLVATGTDTNGQATLPTSAFAFDWTLDDALTSTATDALPQPYIEGEGTETGPWLYADANGFVLICLDETVERNPFRADLIATSRAIPSGRVTNPEAKGQVIRMDVALPEDQARAAHAVVAFTGDYIGYTANRKSVMIRNGVVYYDRAEQNTLALLPDGTMALYEKGETNAEALLALGVRDSFCFGPTLAVDGVSTNPKGEGYTMRVAFGYTDPFHYLAVVGQRDREVQLTLQQIANICAGYGCRIAYNLDGGHSTSLVFLGRELSLLTLTGTNHHNIRGLSDVIVFLENDRVQPKAEQ